MCTVGIKFCGGCHVSYERKELLGLIRQRHHGKTYEYVSDGGIYDYILALCCCPAECADCSTYTAREALIRIDHMLSDKEIEKIF